MADNDLSLEKIYLAIREDIRRTDDISFRLLGLVPLVSGVGLLSILFSEKVPGFVKDGTFSPLGASVLTALSLFAAVVTLGLLRWELRNVQSCNWLLERAKRLEEVALASNQLSDNFFSKPVAPDRIGKEISEKLIYSGTIATWLALPAASRAINGLSNELVVIYYITIVLIATVTGLSWFSKASAPKL